MTQNKVRLILGSTLAAVAAVGAQSTSTASIVEVIFDSVDLSGQVAGVGADGTTYVLSATYTVDSDEDTTIALPITMTLVEDATHVSEAIAFDITGLPSGVALGFGDGIVSFGAECDIANGEAACTEHAVQGTILSTDNIETIPVSLQAVPVVVTAGAATGGSQTSSTPAATATTSGAKIGYGITRSVVGFVCSAAVLAMLL